ncbi:MAG: hypothetical protein C0417_05410 [Chlorobiaceae bacterium]|nr:hypothetical protein [Chlorobiaceae bacterium]
MQTGEDKKYSYSNKNRSLFFLILSCSGGAGHIRAAESLHRTSPLTGLPIYTKHYDVLNFTSKLFKQFYAGSYMQMVNRVPELWGYLYDQSEKKAYKKHGLIKTFDKFNYSRYFRMLKELNPDAIICTHFLPYVAITKQLRAKGITAPVFAVTTDFDVHQLWVDPIVERYFVYHAESAWQLHAKNIPLEKIITTGIPVMPEFQLKSNPKTIRTTLGISPDQFTILVLSGGFGMGRVSDIVERINTTLSEMDNRKFNLLIVCGKNEKLRSEIEAIQFPHNIFPTIYGFVDNIHELMDASDLLISKSGGLTSSEAMAKSLPILIVEPIPGQESRNADIIVEHGAGWKSINVWNLGYKLKQIFERPSMIAEARKATQLLAKPNAADEILKYVYKHLTSKVALDSKNS